MKIMRGKVILGSTLLILGFIIYQLGTTMLIAPGSHLSELAETFITPILQNQTPEMVAVAIQYGGGIIAAIGLVTAITGVAANGEVKALKSTINRLESTIQNLQANQLRNQIPKPTCRFCGADMAVNDSFCPKCGRAQI
jgi:hypothetical protein